MLMTFQEYRNTLLATKIKEMFGPHGEMGDNEDPNKPPLSATAWTSNMRFSPKLRQSLAYKQDRRRKRGKLL
jgi:hypothetical protein